jgi:gas vesicle protein
MSDHKDVIIGTTIGIGFGVLAGVVFGLLYAPKSGKELRHDIQAKAHDVSANIRAKMGHGKLDDVVPH